MCKQLKPGFFPLLLLSSPWMPGHKAKINVYHGLHIVEKGSWHVLFSAFIVKTSFFWILGLLFLVPVRICVFGRVVSMKNPLPLPGCGPLHFKHLLYVESVVYGFSSSFPFLTDRDSFVNREFSYTLQDDIYVRYQSFTSREALEESIKTTVPHKIDIGAIFNHKVTSMIWSTLSSHSSLSFLLSSLCVSFFILPSYHLWLHWLKWDSLLVC